ncbi:MAG: sulfatase-like hydrolase/transferase [Deltaproteobacteria bacterium]|nr:sulfatase-like hydrolase/transferase [Deltaproteobacteria bacterium]MBI3390165.1 sulfatase-like hydrolase/transferase [Deltaproteobacteria bacterium]
MAIISASMLAALMCAAAPVSAQNARGSATGPTKDKGYNHPDQFITMEDVPPADNMYPVIKHAEQEKQARDKLAALEKKTGKKPNILIFLLDDVGWMDMGFNGGGIAVGNETPTMDRLANEGLNLTSAYSTPSCSPTRATIHTGQNPLHHGILRPPMYGEKGGLDGAVTLPSVLKKLGYVTHGVGKWHMGENKGSLPQNVGYDDYLGFLGVSDMYTEWRDEYLNPEVALSPERFAMMVKDPFNHTEVHCTSADHEKCESGKEIDLDYIKHLDRHWMENSVEFIKKMKDAKEPFFLYHATRGCHFDNYPDEEFAGKSRARTVFSDCMVHMDRVLGELVKTLEETGQLDNTLIFLTSDNGPECEIPPHGRTPFRGCKGSTWEGGVRVPTFAYWKGMIAPRRSEGLFDLADLFNTGISLAGKPGAAAGEFVPKTTYLDGIDQTGLLLADNGESARKSRPYTLNQYFAAMRVDEFKYIFTAEIENGMFQKGDIGGFSGTIATETGGGIVVNLYTNPQEDASIGVRHIPMAVPVMGSAGWYYKELIKYPPQFKIGFLSNNPPVYDIIPKAKEALEKMEMGKRPAPQ